MVEDWEAYHEQDPWGDDWERSSMIATSLMNLVGSMAPRAEGDEPPPMFPQDLFVPGRKHKDTDQEKLDLSLRALENLPGL